MYLLLIAICSGFFVMSYYKERQRKITNQKRFIGTSICIILFLVMSGKIMLHSILYELAHTYTGDAPLYWTVGRGILNGIKPYEGLYENKPVGIFLIAAASFQFTGSTILCNVVSVCCLLVIGVLPAMIYGAIKKEEIKKKNYSAILMFFIALAGGMMVMLYCEDRSGAFQVESIGACFVGLYYWAIIHIKQFEKSVFREKKQIVWMVLAALFLLCAVMMKEPFVLVAMAGACMLIKNVREGISRILIPGLVAGILGVLELLGLGILDSYIMIYLKNMLLNRIGSNESCLSRGLHIKMLYNDLSAYSSVLAVFLLVMILLISIPRTHKTWIQNVITIGKVAMCIYIASVTVGLGICYYNHHFVFAAPLYILLLSFTCIRVSHWHIRIRYLEYLPLLVTFLLLVYCTNVKSVEFHLGEYMARYESIVQKAQYVDNLLDFYGESRYQFIGFNGESSFYGLTKHSPQGPVFVQDPLNFANKDTWFAKQLMKQIKQSNIIIFSCYYIPVLKQDVQYILDTEFTTTPAKVFSQELRPDDFNYVIYYRKSVFE